MYFLLFQTLCDGARHYAEKIENILESNCYYDIYDDNNQFDLTDQVCSKFQHVLRSGLFCDSNPGNLGLHIPGLSGKCMLPDFVSLPLDEIQ